MSIICTCFFKYSRQLLAELFFTLDEYLPRHLQHLIIISIRLNQQESDKESRGAFFFLNVRLYVIKHISVAVMAVHQNPLCQ